MGINFPNAPAVGELHPTPPQAGVPQYRWDGVAWVAQSQDQLAFVKRTGDTMSGALTLPADPAAALQAATKQYVDAKSSLYISDNPPVSPPDGSMWWDSDNGLLYIRYNDGAGPSQWVQAVATPAIDASVFVNKAGDTMGGALTLPGDPAAALQAAPKQYVDAVRAYAAPYDAIAYSGMQINGGMLVSQESGYSTVSASGFVCDGWKVAAAGTTMAVTAATYLAATYPVPPGQSASAIMTVTAAQASMAAGDYYAFIQAIEGYRIARLGWGGAGAQPITIAFWTAHNRTGTYTGTLRNSALNKCYAFSYTQNAANTWEYKTVTIPGDTTGVWLTNNNNGILLCFALACGTTFTAPSLNTWLASNYLAGPGQVNAVGATSDVFRITGITVLPGTQAPTAAQSPTIMRPYDQELQTCRRYYYKRQAELFGYATTGAGAGQWFSHPVIMRAAPAITFSGGTPSNASAPTHDVITVEGFRAYAAAIATGQVIFSGYTQIVDARL